MFNSESLQLASMLLPAPARAKEEARRAKCMSDLRQVSIANMMYAGDSARYFSPRIDVVRWPTFLLSYYKTTNVLRGEA